MQTYNRYLILILLFTIVIFASGCTDNNISNNNSSGNSPQTQVNSSSADIIVTVSYQGTWNGTISDDTGNRTVQGTGNGRFNLGPNHGMIGLTFQKLGNDNLLLRVEILNGTNLIQRQTNRDPFGIVSITQKF